MPYTTRENSKYYQDFFSVLHFKTSRQEKVKLRYFFTYLLTTSPFYKNFFYYKDLDEIGKKVKNVLRILISLVLFFFKHALVIFTVLLMQRFFFYQFFCFLVPRSTNILPECFAKNVIWRYGELYLLHSWIVFFFPWQL